MPGQHEHQLVQSMALNGEGLDLSFLIRATFIETMSLDGPKLIVTFNDRESILRDDMGITESTVISVVLADPFNSGELDWSAEWVIMTMPVDEDDNVTFNLIPKMLHDLKRPAPVGRCFVQLPVSNILRRLAPNVPIDVGTFPFKRDFHLLPAQRSSRLLRQIAKELGAVVFIRRGTLVFRTLDELYNQPAKYEYHYNDTRQVYQIAQYTLPNDGSIVEDLTHRRYIGWDDVKGVVKSSRHSNSPIEHCGATSKAVLDNLSKIPVVVLDANTQGNGGLQSGVPIGIVWNRSDLERPIDESLPVKVVLGTVAHSFEKGRYLNRIKGVLNK